MARSDLLITLVKAGKGSSDPKFRSAVEALISEERAKKHNILADELAKAISTQNAPVHHVAPSPITTSFTASSIGDLVYETYPDKGMNSLFLAPDVEEECGILIQEHFRAEILRSYSLEPRNKVLLVGPPGNGKTSLAHALAHDLMVPLITVRYEGLIGSYLGETTSRLRKIFDHAKQRPCVLFFDEFDTVGKERGDTHETGEIKRVVSTLLMQMDQLPSYVIIVTATNHAELLDRAVWRRFQLRLRMPAPSAAEVDKYLKLLFSTFSMKSKVSLTQISKALVGATYSEIEEFYRDVCRRAVLQIPSEHFEPIIHQCLNAWKVRVKPSDMK